VCFIDDGCSVAPGKNGREKTRDFNILFFGKRMWNTDGILVNKRKPIECIGFFI